MLVSFPPYVFFHFPPLFVIRTPKHRGRSQNNRQLRFAGMGYALALGTKVCKAAVFAVSAAKPARQGLRARAPPCGSQGAPEVGTPSRLQKSPLKDCASLSGEKKKWVCACAARSSFFSCMGVQPELTVCVMWHTFLLFLFQLRIAFPFFLSFLLKLKTHRRE